MLDAVEGAAQDERGDREGRHCNRDPPRDAAEQLAAGGDPGDSAHSVPRLASTSALSGTAVRRGP